MQVSINKRAGRVECRVTYVVVGGRHTSLCSNSQYIAVNIFIIKSEEELRKQVVGFFWA